MTPLPLLVLSLALLAVALIGASGVGSTSRIIELHVPYIGRTDQTWINGHRAARTVIVPTSALAALLGLVALLNGAEDSSLHRVGWIVYLAGLAVGCILGSLEAKRTLIRSSRTRQ